MPTRNPAARIGRWSAHHRRTAILGWILFVVLATVLGGKVGHNYLDKSVSGAGESKRADMIVKDAGFPGRAGERVLVQGRGPVRAGDPRITAAVRDVVRRLQRIDGITRIESPLDPAAPADTVSRDGRSVAVDFEMPGSDEHVKQLVARPLAAVA